jgi:hypothetical protein
VLKREAPFYLACWNFSHLIAIVYNCRQHSRERASYNGSIEASQASDVGSIPIARSNKTGPPCISPVCFDFSKLHFQSFEPGKSARILHPDLHTATRFKPRPRYDDP